MNPAMSETLTVRAPMQVDSHNLSLRRGYLDVYTPIAHQRELEIPPQERRVAILECIREMQEERAGLKPIIGRTGKRAGKNMAYKANTDPDHRKAVRTSNSDKYIYIDRFLQLGLRIQELQNMLRDIPRNSVNRSETTGGAP